ncbi:MAG: hypothetical protein H6Q90_3977 [Deltaproteobacteria bacterium]|nr:hypothetical protein [Deltaproteobacteria bacterium]
MAAATTPGEQRGGDREREPTTSQGHNCGKPICDSAFTNPADRPVETVDNQLQLRVVSSWILVHGSALRKAGASRGNAPLGVMANPLHHVPRMRLFLTTCALLPLAACAARYRTELVGQGNALVMPRQAGAPTDAVAAPGAGGIELAQGSYDVALRFDIPRAQRIEWRVRCPGADLEGAVGEPFEAYRSRRLAELRAQRERDRQRMAAATGVVVQAVAPRAWGEARVRTPAGELVVQGETPVVVTAAPPPPPPEAPPEDEELPYNDTGRGRLGATLRLDTNAAGVCTITAATDDPDVLASFQVIRVHDLRAEARQARAAQTTGAIEVRTRIRSRLVALGADETARQRRLDAQALVRDEAETRADLEARARAQVAFRARVEANARAQAEGRLRAEAEARADLDAKARLEAELRLRWEAEAPKRAHAELMLRWRTQAYTTRDLMISWLVTRCHADPDLRARLEAQARAERLRIRTERDARAAHQAALVVELEHRRTEDALRVRAQISGALVAMGARLRPPRPEAPFENPGSPPFDGARWSAGAWAWNGTLWIWTAGGWTDPDSFGATGGEVAVRVDREPEVVGPAVVVSPTIVVNPPVVYDAGLPSHQPSVTIIRDHRPPPPSYQPPPPPIRVRSTPPIVRDHRPAVRPAVRDHRKAKPDDSPTVRDHRRSR